MGLPLRARSDDPTTINHFAQASRYAEEAQALCTWRNAASDMIPLRALVADVETILGPLSITRYNQVQAAALSGSNREGRDPITPRETKTIKPLAGCPGR